MPDRILIIHPSELIRNGLREACRDFRDMDISLLANGEAELNSLIKKRDFQVLMIDVTSSLASEIKSRINKNKSFKTIGIYYPAMWAKRAGGFDAEINTDMEIDEIRESIRKLLGKVPGTTTTGAEGHQLTNREQELVKLLVLGHSHKEIGSLLSISIHTVISHRKNITQKLGIKSVSGLAVYAIITGLIDTDKIDPQSLI